MVVVWWCASLSPGQTEEKEQVLSSAQNSAQHGGTVRAALSVRQAGNVLSSLLTIRQSAMFAHNKNMTRTELRVPHQW